MQYMNVVRVSPFSGKKNTMGITLDINDYIAWMEGKSIQDAFPYLTADEREFIKTGITPQEWEKTFGKDS